MVRLILSGLCIALCLTLSAPLMAQDDVQSLKEQMKVLQDKVTALEQKAPAAKVEEKKDDKPYFNVWWKEGPYFETSDKAFSLAITGRAIADFGFIKEDVAIQGTLGHQEDYAEMRYMRLGLKGTIYENFIFEVELEFAGNSNTTNSAVVRNGWLGIKNLPMNGTFKVGYFKEPIGLEQLTSDNYVNFMERAMVAALTPGFNIGLAYTATDESKKFTFTMGLFRETTPNARITAGNQTPPGTILGDSGAYAWTMRFTAAPMYENKGEQVVHIGLAYSYRNPTNNTKTYSSKPEVNGFENFLITSTLTSVEDIHLAGLEAAFVFGPFSLQSEVIYSWLRSAGGTAWDREHFWGYYVAASFFLTGEHRNYTLGSATFGRIKPKANLLGKDGGMGAFEFAMRYSKLDLNEDTVFGGRMDNVTIGLNWYWNPNMMMMFNYVYTRVSHPSAFAAFAPADQVDAHMFVTRFHFSF